MEERAVPVPDPKRTVKNGVTMRNFTTSWLSGGKESLKHVSMDVHPGKLNALIGLVPRLGTTIVKQLTGFSYHKTEHASSR